MQKIDIFIESVVIIQKTTHMNHFSFLSICLANSLCPSSEKCNPSKRSSMFHFPASIKPTCQSDAT